MPAWKDKLSDQDIDAVIAWMQSRWPEEIYSAWLNMETRTKRIMPGVVYPSRLPAQSWPDALHGRRLAGRGRRVIVLTVLASLFVYLVACTVAAVGLSGSTVDGAGTTTHHDHPAQAPEQQDCCASLQDVLASARQKNILPSLLSIVAPFFSSGRFRLRQPTVPVACVPPADPPWPHGRSHLDNTLRPRAPPR